MTTPALSGASGSDPLIIRFSGVSKFYDGASPVLDAIDFSVRRGEKVVLMGDSGCGKTTLLRCINGLESVHAGTLIVNDADLRDPALDWQRFRSRIGMVFQQFNLFPHLTVLENIVLAPVHVRKTNRGEAVEQAMHLLTLVDLADKAHRRPEQLSGGQKQRVAIARSLAMSPDILLLDEPTSALDPAMSREVLSVIRRVAGPDVTLVMVTHEVRFALEWADRLAFLSGGRVTEEGLPTDILRAPQTDALKRYLDCFPI